MSKLLLKNGKVLDKSENLLYEDKDVLIENNHISKIDSNIECEDAEIIDCNGKTIAPGFIDIHVHCFPGCPKLGITADSVGVSQGVTSVMDAGTAGPENFEQFIDEVVKPSKTRVFSAMNYSKMGLWVKPEGDDESKWDIKKGVEVYNKYPDIIVAIKARASNSCVGALGIKPIKAAKELASKCNIPLYVHIGHPLPMIEDTLAVMQEGDIITHSFHGKNNGLLEDGKIKPETQAARERGVKFDVGHGRESFNFNTLKAALSLGFYPDCVSTDLHEQSINHPVRSLTDVMDKMVLLGIPLEDTVADVTSNPAELLNLKNLGKLKEGYLADITIFHVEDTDVELTDSDGNTLITHQTIVPDMAIVDGKVEMKR